MNKYKMNYRKLIAHAIIYIVLKSMFQEAFNCNIKPIMNILYDFSVFTALNLLSIEKENCNNGK